MSAFWWKLCIVNAVICIIADSCPKMIQICFRCIYFFYSVINYSLHLVHYYIIFLRQCYRLAATVVDWRHKTLMLCHIPGRWVTIVSVRLKQMPGSFVNTSLSCTLMLLYQFIFLLRASLTILCSVYDFLINK